MQWLDFALGLLGIGFAAWAGVVKWSAGQLLARMDYISNTLGTLTKNVAQDQLENERRLTRIEERLRVITNKGGGFDT